MSQVIYIRKGRKYRATGTLVNPHPFYCGDGGNSYLVKPDRGNWKRVIISDSEFAAGTTKPPPVKRGAKQNPKPPRKKREPKPKLPRWRKLLERVRRFVADPTNMKCIPFTLDFITDLASELEDAHAQLQAAKDLYDELLFNGR